MSIQTTNTTTDLLGAVQITTPELAKRRCIKCGATKELELFKTNSHGKFGRANTCKECDKARVHAWAQHHPDERALAYRRRHLKRTYNMTEAQYAEMLARQNGVCAICGRPDSGREGAKNSHSFCVDHSHETRLVRGLLCFSCNAALGSMDDSPERLERAAAYLRNANVAPLIQEIC